MHTKVNKLSSTEYQVQITADEQLLSAAKDAVLAKLGKNIKVAGFREGKAPTALIEKSLDQNVLQSEFLDEAMSRAYSAALIENSLRPVSQPSVELGKYVPFTTLEFSAKFDVVGDIKLADYKKLSVKKPIAEVTADEISQVIGSMQKRLADRKEADRPAKDGDEVWIDFKGVDQKGQDIKGASGQNYPLIIGSKTFIPGFEENMLGLKAESEKTFTVTFPKDYGAKSLQNARVTFTVKVLKVQEVIEPKIDDAFAEKVSEGQVKTVTKLKEDVKQQLTEEKQRQSAKDYEAAVVTALVEKSDVELPQSLIDQQVENVISELKQNITYRGMTYQEYLDQLGQTEAEHREKEILPEAVRRLKGGYLLAEVAEKESIDITPEELEARVKALKNQYKSDESMQKELEKEENMRDIAARMLTEKTIERLMTFVKG